MFESLFAKRSGIIKPGLERIQKAYEVLSKPGVGIPTVLVGGTNGKGTTCAYLHALMSTAGVKVGLYTSPHLYDYNERFTIGSETASTDAIIAQWNNIKGTLGSDLYDQLSFFELSTLIALQLFVAAKCDFIILEVGMGGRFDATNVCDPVCSVLTGVALDHTQYLGNSAMEIACEKVGIFRPGRAVFMGQGGELKKGSALWEFVHSFALRLESSVFAFGEDFESLSPHEFLVNGRRLRFPGLLQVSAPYLRHNFVLATAVFIHLQQLFPLLAQTEVFRDLENFSLKIPSGIRGRFEFFPIASKPGLQLLVDVAHNVDGAQALVTALSTRFPKQRLPALVSMMADKDIGGILKTLGAVLQPIILFRSSSERSIDCHQMQVFAKDEHCFEDFDAAWSYASEKFPANGPWVVTGSVAAMGEVIRKLHLI